MPKKKKKELEESIEKKEYPKVNMVDECYVEGCHNLKMDESDVCIDHYEGICDELWDYEVKWRKKHQEQMELINKCITQK